jgi:hypothetical protein
MCNMNDLIENLIEKNRNGKEINEKEGLEHKRLQSELEKWARNIGYNKDGPRFKGRIPDVVLTNQDGDKLFVGDAKDAKNETVNNEEAVSRIKGYMEEFLRFIKNGEYKEGIFAITTNDQDAAKKWCIFLNEISRDEGMNFEIEKKEHGSTWIIWSMCSE